MTRGEAIGVLECMAIDLVGAMADMRETNPMLDVLRQRVDAINIAQSVLRHVSREQVEKVRGEWRWVGEDRWNDCYECGKCGKMHPDNSLFCPACGAPMTDEAVQMVMERLERLYGEKEDS